MNLYRQFCNIPPSPRTKLREVMFSVVSIGQSLCQSFCSQGVPMLLHMGMFKLVHLGTSTQPQPPALPTQRPKPLRLKSLLVTSGYLKDQHLEKRDDISQFTTAYNCFAFFFKMLQVLCGRTALSHEIYPKDRKVPCMQKFTGE